MVMTGGGWNQRSSEGSYGRGGTDGMSTFTDAELRYLLEERLLGRLATVGADGMPHVAPVGWTYNAEHDTIDVGGRRFETTKKFRDVRKTQRAAIVVDDVLAGRA
jgi:pyridoxamine 5'-phosphate oxidase family protein